MRMAVIAIMTNSLIAVTATCLTAVYNTQVSQDAAIVILPYASKGCQSKASSYDKLKTHFVQQC